MKAVVLAGGFGNRLRPLTDNCPKPMLVVAGKPILEWTLIFLEKHGFDEAIIALHYLPDKIINYFGAAYGKLKLSYVVEKEPLGKAGILNLAKGKLKETFLIIYGDNLYDFDVAKMLEQHKSTNAIITTAIYPVDDTSQLGAAKLNGKKIVDFIEKPAHGSATSNLADIGIYFVNPKVMALIPKGRPCDTEREIYPKLIKMGKLYGYVVEGVWLPNDTVEKYEQAQKSWHVS